MIHFVKLSLSYILRAGAPHKLATIWAYSKITLVDRFNLPRNHLKLFGWQISFPSARSLRQVYEEIFLGEHYRLHPVWNAAPLIIDAGANIGVATVYFKLHYPSAQIICFEPHPVSFSYLKRNLAANGVRGVEAHQVALGARAEGRQLFGLDLGASLDVHRGEALTGQPERSLTVPVRPVSEFIDARPVDVLKLDIEGHEGVVLETLGPSLRRVGQVVMEYHRWPESTPLSGVLEILEANEHDYEVKYWLTEGTVSTCVVRTRLNSSA